MYNRYIRNDTGTYIRIPQEDSPPPKNDSSGRKEPDPAGRAAFGGESQRYSRAEERSIHSEKENSSAGFADGLSGFLRHILDQLHLDHVDTGDLLLLALLFLLFREDADEELLVALGLLLIL